MLRLLAILLSLALVSCASFVNRHRMKAAQRKMLDAHRLQHAGDWEGALTMASGMRSSVSKAVSSAPVQTSATKTKIDLRPLLAAWENGPLTELNSALQKKDAKRSTAAFASLRQQCINCHAVLGKTEVQVSNFP